MRIIDAFTMSRLLSRQATLSPRVANLKKLITQRRPLRRFFPSHSFFIAQRFINAVIRDARDARVSYTHFSRTDTNCIG